MPRTEGERERRRDTNTRRRVQGSNEEAREGDRCDEERRRTTKRTNDEEDVQREYREREIGVDEERNNMGDVPSEREV